MDYVDDFDENAMFSKDAIARAPGRAATTPGASNPLSKYFRIPGLHVALPTGGAYFPPGAATPNMAGEYEVYPMRASDELLLKSPDALMSGYAIEKMLESCVPSIKTPRLVSTPDLDVLLLAIRAASYGDKMDIEVACPECKADNVFACDIPSLLGRVKPIPQETPVRLSPEVVVYLRPYNLHNATRISLAAFQETRNMQNAENEPDEARTKIRNECFARLNKLGIAMSSDCILKIAVPEGEVTDPAHIKDFVDNIQRAWMQKIDSKLKELNGLGMDKSLDVECTHCHHQWKTDVEFDPASFFDPGS